MPLWKILRGESSLADDWWLETKGVNWGKFRSLLLFGGRCGKGSFFLNSTLKSETTL